MNAKRPVPPEALLDGLVQTSYAVMAVLTRVAAEHELSLTQLRVLAILRDHRPRMAELAAYLGLEKSTMSGLIARAEQRGLLERRPSAEDARAGEVVMTAAGRRLAARVLPQVQRGISPLLDDLSAADRRTLTRLLGRMTS